MESLNAYNLNEYLKQNPCDNSCKHQSGHMYFTPYQNYKDYYEKWLKLPLFDKISNMYDKSIGSLSWVQYQDPNSNNIYTGCFPYFNSDIYKCRVCGHLLLIQYEEKMSHSLIEYDKEYIFEPIAKSVLFDKRNLQDFIKESKLFELENPANIERHEYNKHEQQILKASSYSIFDFREKDEEGPNSIHFDIVGKLDLLIKIHELELKYK